MAQASGGAKAPTPIASTFDALKKASEPATKMVELEDGPAVLRVVVRELNGRERFAMTGEFETDYERMLHMAHIGMVEPASPGIDELNELRPEWVMQIAMGIAELSGIHADAEEESEND